MAENEVVPLLFVPPSYSQFEKFAQAGDIVTGKISLSKKRNKWAILF